MSRTRRHRTTAIALDATGATGRETADAVVLEVRLRMMRAQIDDLHRRVAALESGRPRRRGIRDSDAPGDPF